MKKLLVAGFIIAMTGFIPASLACDSMEESGVPLLQPVKMDEITKTEATEKTKCLSHTNECQKGITTYVPNDELEVGYDNYMQETLRTNTRNLVLKYGDRNHKIALKLLNELLANKRQLPDYSPDMAVAMSLFDDCLNYKCPNISGINDTTLPNTDVAKYIVSIDGNNGLGTVMVRIIARHNDQYFLMTGRVDEPNLDIASERCMNKTPESDCSDIKPSKALSKCQSEAATASSAKQACFVDYVKATPLIKTKIQATIDGLLKQFELE